MKLTNKEDFERHKPEVARRIANWMTRFGEDEYKFHRYKEYYSIIETHFFSVMFVKGTRCVELIGTVNDDRIRDVVFDDFKDEG